MIQVVMDTLILFIVEIADRSLLSELRGIYEETVSYSESHRYFVRSYPTFPQQLQKKSQPRNVCQLYLQCDGVTSMTVRRK